jgi:hypothetical protein
MHGTHRASIVTALIGKSGTSLGPKTIDCVRHSLTCWSVNRSVSAIIWMINPCRFTRQVSEIPELAT